MTAPLTPDQIALEEWIGREAKDFALCKGNYEHHFSAPADYNCTRDLILNSIAKGEERGRVTERTLRQANELLQGTIGNLNGQIAENRASFDQTLAAQAKELQETREALKNASLNLRAAAEKTQCIGLDKCHVDFNCIHCFSLQAAVIAEMVFDHRAKISSLKEK